MFNNQINDLTIHAKDIFCKKISEYHLPIILYGATEVAQSIYLELLHHHLPVVGVCVDSEYYSPSLVFNDLKVFSLDTLDDFFDDYLIVISFGKVIKTKECLKTLGLKNCRDILFMPNIDFWEPITFSFIESHLSEFTYTYNLLSDDLSRKTFLAVLNSKIGNEKSFDLEKLWQEDQYFIPEINLSKEDEIFFVDCGAFSGDTLLDFLSHYPKINLKKYYAFEPDPANIAKLNETISSHALTQVEVIPKGVWQYPSTLNFDSKSSSNSAFNDASTGLPVPVTSIDAQLNGEPASFIKMDIEGCELEALKGASYTISTFMPILAICVYHKCTDLITIPQYLNSISSKKYTFYLRHHSHTLTETVLYAIPNSN